MPFALLALADLLGIGVTEFVIKAGYCRSSTDLPTSIVGAGLLDHMLMPATS
ncbi:MAG: hypothetical protein ABI218_13875 [Caldimonas sp.]